MGGGEDSGEGGGRVRGGEMIRGEGEVTRGLKGEKERGRGDVR